MFQGCPYSSSNNDRAGVSRILKPWIQLVIDQCYWALSTLVAKIVVWLLVMLEQHCQSLFCCPPRTIYDGLCKAKVLVIKDAIGIFLVTIFWRIQKCYCHPVLCRIAPCYHIDVIIAVDQYFRTTDWNLQCAATLQAESCHPLGDELVPPDFSVEPQVLVLGNTFWIVGIENNVRSVLAVQRHAGLIDEVAAWRYRIYDLSVDLGDRQFVLNIS